MSKPAGTYMKRELKKVLPVLLLAVCYAIFVFILAYLTTKDMNADFRVRLAMERNYFEVGDIFIYYLYEIMDQYHAIAVILLELLLIRRVFYLENRAGISDFLRILPIRERSKITMKICAGELVLLLFSVVFGVCGTITYSILQHGLEESTILLPIGISVVNTYQTIWQISLLMFLAMSAIFLVLFVLQCCIHNMPLAMAAGAGLLFTPYFYTKIYERMSWAITDRISTVTASFLVHCPEGYVESAYPGNTDVSVFDGKWEYFGEILGFQVGTIVLALIVLVIALCLRWNIKESNSVLINSPGVTEFIITGMCISVGAGIALITGNANRLSPTDKSYSFFIVTLVVAVILWILYHVIVRAVSKRRRGM